MNARIPHYAARRSVGFTPVIPSPQSPEFAALVDERVALIKSACLICDVFEALGGLAGPNDMTVICASYRFDAGVGVEAVLGTVLPAILDREWREMADKEITDELNKRAAGLVAEDWIPQYVLAREIAIAQMKVNVFAEGEVQHG